MRAACRVAIYATAAASRIAATASRAARLTLRACRGRHAAQGSVRREASRRAAASGLGSICFLLGDASSKKETAGARRRQRCWPLTVRSCSALERTLDRMQCDEHPADMRLHNLQRQVASHPHAWIS